MTIPTTIYYIPTRISLESKVYDDFIPSISDDWDFLSDEVRSYNELVDSEYSHLNTEYDTCYFGHYWNTNKDDWYTVTDPYEINRIIEGDFYVLGLNSLPPFQGPSLPPIQGPEVPDNYQDPTIDYVNVFPF